MWSLFKADVIDFILYYDLEMLSTCLKGVGGGGGGGGISAAFSASARACVGEPVHKHISPLS